MTVFAKQVLKNKFWIVEDAGEKVATIQMVDDGSVVYVSSTERKKYASIKLLSKDYNIVFDKEQKKSKEQKVEYDAHEYPVSSKPWNVLYDVKHKFPIYTKTNKSKSYFCAGYYIIKFNNGWVKSFCPKFITLNRYEYQGPYKTKLEMQEQLRLANGK
jgi:hypothetical protein